MNEVESQAPLLEKLSDAEKDALIGRLWRDLQAERARSRELERRLAPEGGEPAEGGREASPLWKRLQQSAAGDTLRGNFRQASTLDWGAASHSCAPGA